MRSQERLPASNRHVGDHLYLIVGRALHQPWLEKCPYWKEHLIPDFITVYASSTIGSLRRTGATIVRLTPLE